MLPAAKPRGIDDFIVDFTVIRRIVKQENKKKARNVSQKKDFFPILPKTVL